MDHQIHTLKRAVLLQNIENSIQGDADLPTLEGQLREGLEPKEGRIEGDIVQREGSQSVGERFEWID